jgi:hypothetical protein
MRDLNLEMVRTSVAFSGRVGAEELTRGQRYIWNMIEHLGADSHRINRELDVSVPDFRITEDVLRVVRMMTERYESFRMRFSLDFSGSPRQGLRVSGEKSAANPLLPTRDQLPWPEVSGIRTAARASRFSLGGGVDRERISAYFRADGKGMLLFADNRSFPAAAMESLSFGVQSSLATAIDEGLGRGGGQGAQFTESASAEERK